MSAADPSGGATARLAERLLGMRANREVIPPDPNHSVRWHQHDYPSPWHGGTIIPSTRSTSSGKAPASSSSVTTSALSRPGSVPGGIGAAPRLVSDLEPGEVLEGRDAVIQFDGKWVRAGGSPCSRNGRGQAPAGTVRTRDRVPGPLGRDGGGSHRGDGYLHRAGTATPPLGTVCDSRAGAAGRTALPGRRMVQAAAGRPGRGGGGHRPRVRLQQHAGTVKMSEAAALVGMSEPTFSKYFKRATGQNSATWSANSAWPMPGGCSNAAIKPSPTSAMKWASPTCPTSTGISSTTPAKPPALPPADAGLTRSLMRG